ncbi:MAG: hypothetical protein ACE5IL_02950 [Myxococcota bacterium]
MSYIAPKDYSQDPEIFAKVMRVMQGDLDLSWMQRIGERASFRPMHPAYGLTQDDINGGAYSSDRLPEVVRHNFSMAPRGAILPKGLPSLGYRLNRKSEVWSDRAGGLFEEGKSRRWAPARDVPWSALDGDPGHDARVEGAIRQLATSLSSIGIVASDTVAYWEWRTNQEFHEVKYLMCVQMFDACRIAEAFRKRALYGNGSLGVDCKPLGELLKSIFESDSYPEASLSLHVCLMSFVQALGRHLEWAAHNDADRFLAVRLMQDASRFLAYGIDHVRQLLSTRPAETATLHEHLDLLENVLVGTLGAREMIEPLIVLSGGLEPALAFYTRAVGDYLRRCEAAGLGGRRERSPLTDFLKLLSE